MFLKTLTLKGFKSFADPAVLQLEPGITVVVGPNGSGKSNVVDAVAWVLGAQGPRTVRSGKMEDVIFAGTSSRPALGRAEVSLTIDNSAGKLASDLAEITITRTLFRSGESEYAINGAPCRLLDVQELLSDTGVGRQQHVIIGQGQLDAILNARPEDRRAVIEEAAGVLKFRRRRERSERRLAATEENIERLFDLVREVKRQIRPLERQAAAARSHGALADELHRLRLHVAGVELAALNGRQDTAARARDQLRGAEEALRASLQGLDDEADRTTDELSARREDDLAASLGRVEGLVERARGLAGVLRERKRSLEAALDAAADADVVSTLEAEGARLGEELSAAAAEEERLAPEGAALAEAEREAAAALAAHREAWGDGSELRAADDGLRAARVELASLGQALDRDHQALAQAAARLQAAERRSAGLEAEEDEARDALAATERDRHRIQTEVAGAEGEHTRATAGLEQAEEDLRQAELEQHRAVARADALAKALDDARGAAGAELLAGVEGVVGTLLDLVEVEPGWEDAFEAAAGGSVAAVVVSGSGAARAALSRLREGEAAGAVLALGAAGPGADGPGADGDPGLPAGLDPVRGHVHGRRGARVDGLDRLLDSLLATAVCAAGGWSAAIDLALARPDLVVVTRDGDRFSSTGWRVRSGGGMVTAAVVDEARRREEMATAQAATAAAARLQARTVLETARTALAAALRADDRNEAAHAAARATAERAADERTAAAGAIADAAQQRAEIEDRVGRDGARQAEIEQSLPVLEAAREAAAARSSEAAATGGGIEAQLQAAVAARGDWEVRAAGLAERRRVLADRLGEVERRLAGHVEERQAAAERRRRIEAEATAVDRLEAVVATVTGRLGAALGDVRDRHRRQIEAVRAGGARLEDLRRRRSAAEHELAAARSRLQTVELELAETSVRVEGVVDALRRELGAEPGEALAAPQPELPEGVDAGSRAAAIEAEIERLGPVNPLALEELSALGERHQFLEAQVEDIRRARRELLQAIRTLDEEIMRVFASAFADVNEHFSALVETLFPGGVGRLSLTEEQNLLETGIEVEVRPAGRNVRRLSLLSGGERSLVALAFLFAVFRSRPSPFYLMDEVEAALDDVNLHRFLGLVHEFRDEAQLIIVSHQKRTMEAGDALYGVTMAPGGSSRVVSQRVPAYEGPGGGAGEGPGSDDPLGPVGSDEVVHGRVGT